MAATLNLVLDTSVWINLLATEQPWKILTALGAHCIVPEAVLREIKRSPVTQQTYSVEKHPLRGKQGVQVVELSNEELNIFLELVSKDSVDALGDGEAAAIAIAKVRQCELALDDRKARRIVGKCHPEIRVHMTVDLLLHSNVRTRLGEEASETAFNLASQFGRMHVPKMPVRLK